MKCRALHKGVMTEFDWVDLGQNASGLFYSRILVDGRIVAEIPSSSTGTLERRQLDCCMLLALGFTGKVEALLPGRGWVEHVSDIGSNSPRRTSFYGAPTQSFRPPSQIAPSENAYLKRLCRPDPKVPDTMGWRAWIWEEDAGLLLSPHHGTPWTSAHLAAENWPENGDLRNEAGIHARLVPKHWKIIGWPEDTDSSGLADGAMPVVTGIVERYGRYVLGREGWRAEQAVIRELMAPSTEIGLALEQVYPDAIVHYPDQEDETWTSEKSSELERGSRSLLPGSLAAPSPPGPTPPTATPLTVNPRVPLVTISQVPYPSSPSFLKRFRPSHAARIVLLTVWMAVGLSAVTLWILSMLWRGSGLP